jgi:phytoene dehydrogenase-like protein
MNAVIIGAGVDELVAAHLLARAGNRVLVLDQHGASETTGWMAPEVERALGVTFERRLPDPWAAAPQLELWQDMARSVQAIRKLSMKDAEAWPRFCGRVAAAAKLLQRLYLAPPPDPLGRDFSDLARGLSFALHAHREGREAIEDFLRLLPMPVADLLDDWLESDVLKGLLGSLAVEGSPLGPRAGGTALALLHRHVGSAPGVFRAPDSNAQSRLRSLPGVAIREAAIARITVRAGKVAGVALEGGEELAADLVLSGADPKRTLLELLEPGWLDPELARALRRVRCRSIPPGPPAASLDALERASDSLKYNRAYGSSHAELALDQFLWMRPVPELARYRSPIAGLYLCGQSMHPGAGIPGLAGLHCARAVQK